MPPKVGAWLWLARGQLGEPGLLVVDLGIWVWWWDLWFPAEISPTAPSSRVRILDPCQSLAWVWAGLLACNCARGRGKRIKYECLAILMEGIR